MTHLPSSDSYAVDRMWEAIHPDDLEWVKAEFYKCLRENRNIAMEYRFNAPEAKEFYVRNEAEFLRGPDGKVIKVKGLVYDIT